MHFSERHPKTGKSKYMDPHVLHPSEPSLAGDPADARKTAQPQGDTLE
jgi:hypothetical protein